MKIKDDYTDNDTALSIPPAWFNTLARFYNYLTGDGCAVLKPSDASENNPPVIKVTFPDYDQETQTPENPGAGVTTLSVSPESSADANTSIWTYGGTYGVVVREITRVYFDETATTPTLYGFYRDMTYDKNGMLYSVSAETRYIIDTPHKVELSTDDT